MFRSSRRKIIIGVSVLALAAFAGGAVAATQTKPIDAKQAFLSDVAHRLHVSTAQLQSAIRGAVLDELNTAVAQGRLTKAQAAAIKQRLERDGAMPLAGLLGFGGFGMYGAPPVAFPAKPNFKTAPRGFGPAGRRGFRPADPFGAIGGATKYLAIKPSKLLSQLAAGQTLAQIAAAQGKTASGLEAAIVTQRQRLLDRLVARKFLTSAQAAKQITAIRNQVSKLLNRSHPLTAMMRPAMVFGGRARGWPVP